MSCAIAAKLFDAFFRATTEYFEATDNMANFAGHGDPFRDAQKFAKLKRTECREARLALEQHWAEHGCRQLNQNSA